MVWSWPRPVAGAAGAASLLLPGLTRLQMSKVWPEEDGSPTHAET